MLTAGLDVSFDDSAVEALRMAAESTLVDIFAGT
jgi:hypothetical protein